MYLVACDRIKKVEPYGRNLYVLILYDMNDIRINFLFAARCPKGPSHTKKKFMNLVINASFSLIIISYKIILDYITYYLITLLIFIKESNTVFGEVVCIITRRPMGKTKRRE